MGGKVGGRSGILPVRGVFTTNPRRLVSQRQQRFTLGTAESTSRMLPQEKYDKSKNQAQTNG
jgi:hypothetical protein